MIEQHPSVCQNQINWCCQFILELRFSDFQMEQLQQSLHVPISDKLVLEITIYVSIFATTKNTHPHMRIWMPRSDKLLLPILFNAIFWD